MIFLYKILVYILFFAALPILPLLYLFSEKRRATILFRLGFNTGFSPKNTSEKRLWIHALSVGEVKSAAPLIAALRTEHSRLDIVFTATTKTGFDMANQLFRTQKEHLVNQLGYFPFDIGFCVKKIGRQISPDAIVLVETDLWPNFLYQAQKNRTPVVLINARLSNRSLNGYLMFKKAVSIFFSPITRILAQTNLDMERFRQLGIKKSKISVVGNIKFDQETLILSKKEIKGLKEAFFIRPKTRILIAGSTHEGEEKILSNIFEKIKNRFPELVMIVVPRDPERAGKITPLFLSKGLAAAVMSEMKAQKSSPDVVIVDKMGELSRLYSICDIAFIGGSMVRQGGHNPLEAAAFSKPVLFGRDMSDFLLISKLLVDQGGARQVASETELLEEIQDLLSHKQKCSQMGINSFKVFSQNSGAVKRVIDHLEHLKIV